VLLAWLLIAEKFREWCVGEKKDWEWEKGFMVGVRLLPRQHSRAQGRRFVIFC
jgi:hypothetical protein